MGKILMKGNEAFGKAAIEAGCKYFFGYPITPQNELPEYMSRELPNIGGVFVQAESEVAAINMVYGAAGAGARVMTSSSSPGIALKQEGITYAAGAELPCVVINVMRGGPGLGSIQASQADYFMSTRGGGNGDYRTPVYAPATVQEAVDMIIEAFDVADVYRTPVMVVADGMIGQMMEPVDFKIRGILLMGKILMKGNEAFGKAAIEAGCKYFFGYPITPQNELPEYMSRELPNIGGVFVQAESEVAAINMVYGAAGAGARVMTSSSSPGIALKQEGITYAAGAELPCVVINVMRGGPGLGSIQASQADYFMSTRGGGNGDYRTPVYAPATVQEAVDMIIEAFDVADVYRTPVMVVADGMIGQMMEPVDFDKERKQKYLV